MVRPCFSMDLDFHVGIAVDCHPRYVTQDSCVLDSPETSAIADIISKIAARRPDRTRTTHRLVDTASQSDHHPHLALYMSSVEIMDSRAISRVTTSGLNKDLHVGLTYVLPQVGSFNAESVSFRPTRNIDRNPYYGMYLQTKARITIRTTEKFIPCKMVLWTLRECTRRPKVLVVLNQMQVSEI